MNYQTHYGVLIYRARFRYLAGYSERHHIIPRCMGGKDDDENIVRLTPEEHYVAHLLLVKIHPDSRKLVTAVMAMQMANGKMRRDFNNKKHGWLRRRFSELMQGHEVTAETRKKLREALLGRKLLPEHRLKIIAANTGKKRTSETIERLRLAQTGKRHSPETIEKLKKVNARVHSEDQKAIRRAYRHTEDARLKIAAAGTGRRHSEETKAKMRGRERPPETREKMRIAALKRQASVRQIRDGAGCLQLNKPWM